MLFLSLALATETEGTVGDISYEGGLSETAASYVATRPVSVSHSGGNISIRCMETEKLSARLPYTVYGTAEAPMEAFGTGIGLSVGGDSKSGWVKTRVPSKTSGVSSYEAPLTVNIPKGTTGLTVTQSGTGWVQVTGCSGALKVSGGAGGVYADGAYTSAAVSASNGDVKLVQDSGAVLTGTTSVSAPGGAARLVLATSQGGKLTAKAAEVTVQQTVMGTNSGTLVQGDMGLAGPSISVSGKTVAEVSSQ